ncbi:MAG: carbohydrate kinase family protein [Planctomycetia bacterium]|nr:carbohydrate kinase family protein [Planctomycetia bacterium]
MRETKKVVMAGHLCLDIIPDLSPLKSASEGGTLLEPGRLLRIGPAVMALGGAVANTGIAMAKLGIPTELMGKVGEDGIGKTILEILADLPLPHLDSTRGMLVQAGEVSSYTLVLNPPQVDRCFLHCSGANDTFSPEDLHLDKMEGAALLHFGYPTLMHAMYTQPERLAERLAAIQEQGVRVSMDVTMPDPQGPEGSVDWRRWFSHVLPYVDIFLPSLEETLFMLRRSQFEEVMRRASRAIPSPGEAVSPAAFMTFAQIDDLAGELLELGVEIAGIKLGDQGLYLKTSDRILRCGEGFSETMTEKWQGRKLLAPCFDVPVAGTTGSGDCTIAGFLAGWLQSWSPEETLRFAVAVGACNVQAPDATSGIPSREEVLRRMTLWHRKPTLLHPEEIGADLV